MSNAPGASFGGEGGQPVYIVREWSPGVEMLHEVPGGYGLPYYTPVSEYYPGVKRVMLDGDGMLAQDRDRMMYAQQAQIAATYAAQSVAARPVAGNADTSSRSIGVQLLLLG